MTNLSFDSSAFKKLDLINIKIIQVYFGLNYFLKPRPRFEGIKGGLLGLTYDIFGKKKYSKTF